MGLRLTSRALWIPGQVKPAGVPRINWSHPLARDLICYFFDTGDDIVELVRGWPRSTRATPVSYGDMSPYGPALRWLGTQDASIYFDTANRDPRLRTLSARGFTASCAFFQTANLAGGNTAAAATTEAGIFSRCRINGNAGTDSMVWWGFQIYQNAVDVHQYVMGLGDSTGAFIRWASGFNPSSFLGTTSLNNYHTLTMTMNGAGTSGSGYADGIGGSISGATAFTAYVAHDGTDTTDHIVFGNKSTTTQANNSDIPFPGGHIFWGACWDRELTATEHVQLHNDPYCLLLPANEPQVGLIAVPVLTAMDLAVSAPTINVPDMGVLVALAAVDVTVSAPAFDLPAVDAHNVWFGAGYFGTGYFGLYFGTAVTVADILTSTDLAASAPTLDQPTLGVVVNATATAYADSAPTIGTATIAQKHVLAATGYVDSVPTLGQPALGQAHALAATAITVGAPTLAVGTFGQTHIISASALAAGAPTLAAGTFEQKHALGATALANGLPTLGQPPLAITVVFAATSYVDSTPTLGTPVLGIIVNVAAAAFVDSVPTFSAATMTVTVTATASNIAVSAPTLGIPAATVTIAIAPTALAASSPTLGTAPMAVIVNTVANSLNAGTPVLGQGALGQTHKFVATALAAGAPIIGTGSMATVVYDFVAGSIAVAGPVITTPNMVVIVLLSASNLATAPPVEAQGAIKQTHALAANALAGSSPTLASSAVAQKHVLTANNLTTIPVLGTPTLVELVPDLVLGSRVLDAGLDVLRTEADKVLALTGTPYSYADAVALTVGESLITFDVPAPVTGGRKIASFGIVNGVVVGSGVVHRWAVVDSVNSRLLAHGDISGDQETIMGTAWTLDPIVIIQPGSPP
jgi:hypothetical protein